MSDVQRLAREQQRVEALCLAAIHALARERDLHFRGRRLHRGTHRLPAFAPHLHPSLERDDLASFRGAADGLALRLRVSNAELHRQLAPVDAIPRLVFDMLEQFRAEALAGDEWPGVRRNLRHRFEAWSRGFHDAGLADSARGILLFTVAQIGRARVTNEPALEQIEDAMEATRAGIAPLLGHALAALRRTRHDQAAYAEHALAMARAVAHLLEQAGAAGLPDDATAASAGHETDERLAFGLIVEPDEAAAEHASGNVAPGRSLAPVVAGGAYRIHTSAYDRVEPAAGLVRAAQLDAYRRELDEQVHHSGLNVARLVRELHALLATGAQNDWQSAQEEGLIDGRRLAQLISSPTERHLFRQEQRAPQVDSAVTLLLDCSGSMRQHLGVVAPLVDVLARALDAAGASVEVLGFTTAAWNGGRALRDWQRSGRPPQPGRLNEALHLVFKEAHTPWRHARRGIAALLKAELYREGIDGEALTWAAARLGARSEARRLLIVLSDGCPMDGATQLANGAQYLDQHLQQVAARIEGDGVMALAAIGVGLDLSATYSRCLAIDPDAGLGRALLQEVLGLIAGRRPVAAAQLALHQAPSAVAA